MYPAPYLFNPDTAPRNQETKPPTRNHGTIIPEAVQTGYINQTLFIGET